MRPYLEDPFRGTRERRVLGPRRDRIDAAGSRLAGRARRPRDRRPRTSISAISCAFFPDQFDVGNAAFLVRELRASCGTAWNLETACSSAVVALDTAAALVATGRHDHVLVAVACTYSSVSDESDTVSWFLGDAGAAFVVGVVPEGEGVLATHAIHTAETCGAFYQEIKLVDRLAAPLDARRQDDGTECCATRQSRSFGRAAKARSRRRTFSAKDVDRFAFNTPTAWYARFCSNVLGVDPARAEDHYASYANVGPALAPVSTCTTPRRAGVCGGETSR